MLDVERSLQVMQELKQQGIRLSVDDFGTGYSSLAYLRRMPLDELKIDKAFVQNMLENKGDVQIVRSVIDLAHNFELEAVAEGVESLAALEMLARARLRCHPGLPLCAPDAVGAAAGVVGVASGSVACRVDEPSARTDGRRDRSCVHPSLRVAPGHPAFANVTERLTANGQPEILADASPVDARRKTPSRHVVTPSPTTDR
jgi:hypothetical protein